MDIKDLDRSQFLMLLFLIIFVTSIATAIVTVTLMDQSPRAGVTNTINRVIERVVPGATTTIVKIVKETPTTSEGEQVVKAIELVSPSVVKLEMATDKGNEKLGTGFVVRGDLVATALKNLPDEAKNVSVVKGSLKVPGEIIKRDLDNNIALIRFTATSTLSFDKLVFAKNLPASGQTSVALAYSENGNPEIMMGIVMGVVNTNASSTTSNSDASVIRTGSVIGDNIGGPIVNIAGEVVGIGISRGYALSASTLRTIIDLIK